MTKVIRCNDLGFVCDGVIRAETKTKVIKQAAEHARKVHNLQKMTKKVVAEFSAAIRDE